MKNTFNTETPPPTSIDTHPKMALSCLRKRIEKTAVINNLHVMDACSYISCLLENDTDNHFKEVIQFFKMTQDIFGSKDPFTKALHATCAAEFSLDYENNNTFDIDDESSSIRYIYETHNNGTQISENIDPSLLLSAIEMISREAFCNPDVAEFKFGGVANDDIYAPN